jgi:hypothetical protein
MALVAAGATARAAPPPAPGPLVLDDGQIAVDLVAELGLDKGHVGDPTSLALDAWWGIVPRWTVGVIHSDPSLDQVGVDATLCVNYSTYRCSRAYKGSGLDVRWLAVDGALSVAPRVRAIVRDIDPVKPALTAGALVRWVRGWASITSDPYLRFGLANQSSGNRTALYLPLWLGAHVAARWDVAIHTGYNSDLAVATDGFHVPFTLIVRFAATAHIHLEVEGGFASGLGPQNNGADRDVFFTLGWNS